MKHDYRISLLPGSSGIHMFLYKDNDPLPVFEHSAVKSTEQAFQMATDVIDDEESRDAAFPSS